MPRPKRPRFITSHPSVSAFGPEGSKAREQIILSLEEFETIRLIDYGRMDQSETAQIMNVSRQTVGRILKTGRYKLSKALVQGHRLKVEGGCYKIGIHPGGEGGRGHRRQGRGRGCGGRKHAAGKFQNNK